MRGHCPAPDTPEACNAVFNRMAVQFHEAFGFARRLGVKTCVGSETPLILPAALRDRIKTRGKDPDDADTLRAVYEGTFRRIMASHPLDYYWMWTPEGWTWSGNKPEQYAATVRDLKLAYEARQRVDAPFQLATCGWVLGPKHDRAALDADLPKDVPMSAISRDVGYTEIDPAFGRITGREKWAIPWLESDGKQGLAAVQLAVGRMRRDAADALTYHCTGLMGLQWRTEILAPNVAALAAAAWDQTGWNPFPGKLPRASLLPADGPLGGMAAAWPGRKIRGTDDPVPYQSCRYNFEGYDLKVPNGRYRVTLGFCEPLFDQRGRRIGDFKLQGKTVVQGLDIFARAGKFAALDVAFDQIDVADGWLRLRIEPQQSSPCISAIVVEGRGFQRKINCGGPAYKDYEADLVAVEKKGRSLACDDFYADWARANFGPRAGAAAGRLLASIDGKVPFSVAQGCPSGSLAAQVQPWEEVSKAYGFIEELAAFRSQVEGRGDLDRFDYWLNTFRHHRALAEIRCALGVFETAMKQAEAESSPAIRRQLALTHALPAYQKVLRLLGQVYGLLLATVNTPGGLAMVVNLESCATFWPIALDKPAARLTAALGGPLPPDAIPPKRYQGVPRIIVPTVRTLLARGEGLRLKVIVLDNEPVQSAVISWRPLGAGAFHTAPLKHAARSVYQAELPAPNDDFEYCIEATTAGGMKLTWPATAPEINQTVLVWND